MTINANERIKNAIEEQLPDKEAVSITRFKYEKAKELIYNLPYFYNVKKLLETYDEKYLQYRIDSYLYPDGIVKWKSYAVLNGEYAIHQIILTDCLDKLIVHHYCQYEKKSLQQFLVKSKCANFPEEERNIEVVETEIEINTQNNMDYVERFTRIQKADDRNHAFAEQYLPIVSSSNNDVINICAGSGVEILYTYGKVPVFVQAMNYSDRELYSKNIYPATNMCQNTENLILKINEEVDTIIENIVSKIDSYKSKPNSPQKRMGSNH